MQIRQEPQFLKKSTQFWKNIKIIPKTKNDQDDCQPTRIFSYSSTKHKPDDTLFILENSWNYILRHSTKATAVFLLFRTIWYFHLQSCCISAALFRSLFFGQVWNYNEKLRTGWDSQIVRSKKGKESKQEYENKQYWLEVHINFLNFKWMCMAIFFFQHVFKSHQVL